MPQKKTRIIVAIDGLSATGKSTLARTLAKKIDYQYIDTGAMYRTLVLQCIRDGVKPEDLMDDVFARSFFAKVNLTLDSDKAYLGREDVSTLIRTQHISNQVADFAQLKTVRYYLLKKQRDMGREKGVIMDGRDIGTVVFPQAELKIYLTASAEVRAQRRFAELKAPNLSLEEVRKSLEERDAQDMSRETAPLIKAPDAVLIDNSNMTIGQQLAKVCFMINQKTTE